MLCYVGTVARVFSLTSRTGFVSRSVGGRSQTVNRLRKRVGTNPRLAGELERVREDLEKMQICQA